MGDAEPSSPKGGTGSPPTTPNSKAAARAADEQGLAVETSPVGGAADAAGPTSPVAMASPPAQGPGSPLSPAEGGSSAVEMPEQKKDSKHMPIAMPPATAPLGAPPASVGTGKAAFTDSAKVALLDAASLTEPEDRETRDLALSSLQSLSAAFPNKAPMWEDEEKTRPILLKMAQSTVPEDEQGKCFALGCLWNLAAEPSNRQPMWADAETRKVVTDAAQSKDTHFLELALGIIWNLSPKAANAAAIWSDEVAIGAILAAATSEAPESRQARAFAMAALQNLAEESANREGMWADKARTRSILLTAAGLEDPANKDLRGRAIGALMNLSVEPRNKQEMWEDAAGVRKIFVDACQLKPGVDDKALTCGLAGVWSLAVEPKNRTPMWAEQRLREGMVQAAEASRSADEAAGRARERALGTLQYLSTEAANKGSMWGDERLRASLLQAAQTEESDKMRSFGLGSLWNLSSLPGNQPGMWEDAGLRPIVLETVKDAGPGGDELQERALAIFWNLSASPTNKAPMWQDEQGARAILLSVIKSTLTGGPFPGEQGRLRRQYAFGALRNLSDEASNRATMWMDEVCRGLLLGGADGEDADDELSPKRAIKTLSALAYDSRNSVAMWSDTKGAAAQLLQVAKESKDKDLWLCACRALQALSVEASNKTSMWEDAELRQILADNGALVQAEEHKGRVCALSTLKNMSTEPGNMKGIWNDAKIRKVLLEAAQKPPLVPKASDLDPLLAQRARAIGLGALRNVAAEEDNKVPMWDDIQGLRSSVLGAAEACESDEDMTSDLREAREHALAILRHFAVLREGEEAPDEAGEQVASSRPLWKDCEEAHQALMLASKLPTKEPTDRKARDYAVAALRHLVC